MNNNANVYRYQPLSNTSTPLIVPNAVASPDIAHTSSKMWMTNISASYFVEWNITLYPWTATYVGPRPWPTGFTSSKGLWAIDNSTLLAVNEFVPGVSTVVEINVLTGVMTSKFDLDANDVVSGDFMLTCNNKFIVSTFDSITNQTYVTQYDYATGVIEVQIDVTGTLAFPFGVFQYDGKIYLGNGNTTGDIYWLENWPPYTLNTVPSGNLGVPIDGASQVPGDCSCTFLGSTTTTSTTTSTTTTSTTTSTTSTTSTTTTTTRPPARCYTVESSGGDAWIQYYDELGILNWNEYIPTNGIVVYCAETDSLIQTGGSGSLNITIGPLCNGTPCPTTTTTSTTSTTTTSTTSTTTTSTTTSTTSTTSTTTTTTKFVPTTTTTSTTSTSTTSTSTTSTTTSTTSTTSTTTTTTGPCVCLDLTSSGPISSYTTFIYSACGQIKPVSINVSNSTRRVCYVAGEFLSYSNFNGAVESTSVPGTLCSEIIGCPTTTTSSTTTSTTTTTTTQCNRPEGLTTFEYFNSYTDDSGIVIYTDTFVNACNACTYIKNNNVLGESSLFGQSISLSVEQLVYAGTGTNCNLLGDGFYITDRETCQITEIVDGYIVSITNCPITTTTTSTTTSTTSTTTTIPPICLDCYGYTLTGDGNGGFYEYVDCLGNLVPEQEMPFNTDSVTVSCAIENSIVVTSGIINIVENKSCGNTCD
jgi:hypothetical protein